MLRCLFRHLELEFGGRLCAAQGAHDLRDAVNQVIGPVEASLLDGFGVVRNVAVLGVVRNKKR